MSEGIQVKHVPLSAHSGISDQLISSLNNIYFIHDNHIRPFRVEINESKIQIFKEQSSEKICSFDNVDKIFIGKSPLNEMTRFSGGSGDDFDGNTILIHLGGLRYVFIGRQIYTFTSESEIQKYVSPVGNNDIPYPYAVDQIGQYYLLEEDIIVTDILPDDAENPYSALYHVPQNRFQDILGISDFIGQDPNEPF